MSCKIDITYQEFKERALDKDMIFPVSENAGREDILGWLKATDEFIELKEQEYYLKGEDVKLASKEQRISSLRNEIYRRFKIENKYLGESNIQSEGGTFIHELLYRANMALAEAYNAGTSMEEAKKKALIEMKKVSTFDITDESLIKVLAVSEGVIQEAIETQKKIDPTQKVLFVFENKIYDPTSTKYNLGTVDTLAIYSDKSFGHWDYKTVTPGGTRAIRKTEGGRVVTVFGKEPIEDIKFEGYRMPMNRYREILGKNYGLTRARQVKLVPIVTNYKYDVAKKDYDKTIDYIDSEYTAVDEEMKERLKAIPTSFQTTGNKKLDSSIKRFEQHIEQLTSKRSKYPKSSAEYESYTFRIKKLRKAINASYNIADLDTYFSELKTLFNLVYKENKDVFDLKPGEEGAFTSDELKELSEQVDVYQNGLNEFMLEALEVLKKEKPEDYKKYSQIYEHYIGQLTILRGKVNNAILQRALTLKAEQKVYGDKIGEMGLFAKQFTRFSDFEDNWIFQTASKIIQTSIFTQNQKVDQFKKDLDAIFIDIKKSGMSIADANKALINPATGNLIQPYKKEFYQDQDADFKVKYYSPKADWKETYEKNREKQIEYIRKAIDVDKGIITDAQIEENFQKKLAFWEKNNALYIDGAINKEAWVNRFAWQYLEVNKQAAKEGGFVNEQYTAVENNPVLKKYYDFILTFNKQARDILGVEYEQVPDSFLPWVRKSVADTVFDKTLTYADKKKQLEYELLSDVSLMQDDTFNGERDADGKPLLTIPKWFVAPLRGEDGQIDVSMKSFDIGKTMVLFADMVYKYETMSQIEGDINILKTALLIEDQQIKKGGKPVLGKMMQNIERRLSKGDSIYEVFETLTNAFLYGIEVDTEDSFLPVGDKRISLVKSLLSANNYFVKKSLGLDPRIALASFLGPMFLMQSQAVKGLAFNVKQNKQAYKILAGVKTNKVFKAFQEDAKIVPFLMEFFQTTTDRNVVLDARKFSESFSNKYLNSDVLFKWMRDGETAVDTHLTLAMAMNYGFNKEGDFKRIYNPDNTKRVGFEDYKSIYEILKEDFETGSKFFSSLPNSNLVKFRQAVMEQSKKLKGTMTYDDKAYFQTQLIMRMLMTFKTWMPGVIGERFGGLKFNEKLDGTDWGRYSSLATANSYMAGDTLRGYMKEVLLPALGKFITETATFGYPYKSDKWKPLNEKRLKAIYNREKNKNPDKFSRIVDGKEEVLISFEDFKNIILQNQKATQAELRILIGIMLVMWAMALGGDDDEPYYKNSWEGRTAYRLLARLYSELAFLYSPEEYLRLFGSSIPLIGLARDVQKLLTNTFDELTDFLFGEDSKKDQTDAFYYTVKMIPALNSFSKLIELFPQDVQRER